MKPPYDITPRILKLISTISEKLGEINATFLDKPSPTLRKQNKIKTIHSSLKIEGNTLTEEQITALLDNKRVIGPEKDVIEVINAIKVYESVNDFKSISEKSFLQAHHLLMNGLMEHPGKYRKQGVGIVKGAKVEHLAPPFENVPFLMKDLFNYLESDEIELIKSCVFHYEMEFIHPFIDGNGRMGRLWQTLILLEKYTVFEYIPFETLISSNQNEYYRVLSQCDKLGKSTLFVEYMLSIIENSLDSLLNFNNRNFNTGERIKYFSSLDISEFTRKDYMNTFKNISSSTATRDLKKGIELGLFNKIGEMNKTKYIVTVPNNG
ncbi:Fic family protein [Wenyingzhuangia sp. IMCC45533]